ncbi:MAG: hypothetical protein HQM09_22270 [Candidatus Riflebacteria bacterium]|nr:hypothetical protein [Candidatus Riflebacteria bacterium]
MSQCGKEQTLSMPAWRCRTRRTASRMRETLAQDYLNPEIVLIEDDSDSEPEKASIEGDADSE